MKLTAQDFDDYVFAIGEGSLHIERMSENGIWMCISDASGETLAHFHFNADKEGNIGAIIEMEDDANTSYEIMTFEDKDKAKKETT